MKKEEKEKSAKYETASAELKAEETDLNAKSLTAGIPSKTMSVRQMAELLGLQKTDSYWLVHKNVFKTEIVAGQMRIDLESFENWYASQVKYQKVNGEPPGAKLREESYDALDISRMLGIPYTYVHEVMKLNHVPYITVDYWKRWPKEEFLKWYNSQSRYRMKSDREEDLTDFERSMSMPEMAWLLGVPRGTVYHILSADREDHNLEVIIVADRKRITKESFRRWYEKQNHYHMVYETIEEAQEEKALTMKEERIRRTSKDIEVILGIKESHYRKKRKILPEIPEPSPSEKTVAPQQVQPQQIQYRKRYLSKESENPNYLSLEEAAKILNVTPAAVRSRIRKGTLPAVAVAGSYRIPKKEFAEWYKNHEKK